MKRVAVFMGTRPEGVKMAPVVAALRQQAAWDTLVIGTGQHREMLNQVVRLFGIDVQHDLAVMRPESNAGRPDRAADHCDRRAPRARTPRPRLGQGDTTTVLAAALACFYRRIPIGHVEAGLRTGNLASPFPEEANRKLAAPLVNLHFAPTEVARENLLREGIPDAHITVTGNTVIDGAVHGSRAPGRSCGGRGHRPPAVVRDRSRLEAGALRTAHRPPPENFGTGFEQICEAIAQLAARFPGFRFVYPVHLNPHVRGPVHERLAGLANVVLIPPQDYQLFVALMRHSRLLTDSGGVQEEAPSLAKPVLVMRDTTERPEGLAAGTVKLVGADAQRIVDEVSLLLTDDEAYRRMSQARNPYGDGQAARRIVERIAAFFDAQHSG